MENILQKLLVAVQQQSDELSVIKKKLAESECAKYFENWIPRHILMQFLNYGDTQIAALLKEPDLIISEVGARKFVEKRSFLKFLEKNIKPLKK